MTVYFTASIVGKKHYLSNYNQIVKILTDKGYRVLSDHIIKTSENQIRFTKKEDRIKFHSQLNKWITSCDFMVVETSFPSISVGYEISMALHRGKHVLILYTVSEPPTLLEYNESDKIICERYTKDTLPGIISDFINYLHGNNDSRFTFFITPQISAYLEEVSKKEKLPKSVYLRKLIENDISRKIR